MRQSLLIAQGYPVNCAERPIAAAAMASALMLLFLPLAKLNLQSAANSASRQRFSVRSSIHD